MSIESPEFEPEFIQGVGSFPTPESAGSMLSPEDSSEPIPVDSLLELEDFTIMREDRELNSALGEGIENAWFEETYDG